jgi:hypothetical protein
VGDLPEETFGELALDRQGPAGRVGLGRSVKEIMETLEMVPSRHPPLWSVEVPCNSLNLAGNLQDDLMEVYLPERIVPLARKVGLRAEVSIDLLTGWNLLDLEVRMQVVREIKMRRPKVLMMSPPCTGFNGMHCRSCAKTLPAIREQWFRDATLHLEFCMLLADLQESEGRGWVLERRDRARSWANAKVKDRLSHGSYMAKFDQCRFGLFSKVTGTPIQRRTRFMTNIAPLMNNFHSRFCDQTHQHRTNLEKRCVSAQRYPPALCQTAVDAFRIYCLG